MAAGLGGFSLGEIAGLIGPSEADRDNWRRITQWVAVAAYRRGWEQGRRALLAELADERMKTAAAIEQETRAYGSGGRALFGRPRPGDFKGRAETRRAS